VWTIVTAGCLFVGIDKLLKLTGSSGLRVSEEVEKGGLDKAEHGGSAWAWVKRASLSSINQAVAMARLEDGQVQSDPEREETPSLGNETKIGEVKIDEKTRIPGKETE